MARTEGTAAEILTRELRQKVATLPIFIRPHLGDVLGMLDDWIQSVEARIAALQKMPSAEALRVLTNEIQCGLTAEQIAARQRPTCEGCDE